MRLTLSLVLVSILNLCYAQEETSFADSFNNAAWRIGVVPSAAMLSDLPSLQIKASKGISKHLSVSADLGYLTGTVDDSSVMQGVRLRPELRYYFMDGTGFYVGAAIQAQHVWGDRQGYISRSRLYAQYYEYDQQTTHLGAAITYGVLLDLGRIDIDLGVALGGGLRYTVYDGLPADASLSSDFNEFRYQQGSTDFVLSYLHIAVLYEIGS